MSGYRIVVTRHRRAGQATAELIERQGGDAVLLPLIQISPAVDYSLLDEHLRRLDQFDWVLFSSRNAVDITLRRAGEIGLSRASWNAIKVAAVGTATAEALAAHGIEVGLIPARFRWQELAQELISRAGRGARVLFPRGNLAKPQLVEALREAGLQVETVTVYSTELAKDGSNYLRDLARNGGAHAILLTSDSTAEALARILCELDQPDLEFLRPRTGNQGLRQPLIACLGPNTADVARRFGLPVDIIAPSARIESLIDAVAQALTGERTDASVG